MATGKEWTVEVYDNATGEHYERPCTPEELAFYEQLAKEQANAPQPLGAENDNIEPV